MRIYLFILLTFLGLTAFSQRHRKDADHQIDGAIIEHSRKGVDSFRQHGWVDTCSEERVGHRLHVRPGLTVDFAFTGFVQHTESRMDRGTIKGNVTIKNTLSKTNPKGIYSIVGTPSFHLYNQIPAKLMKACYVKKCTWRVVIDNNVPAIVTTGVDKKKFAWVFNIVATKVN
jgi:hypothetical protein